VTEPDFNEYCLALLKDGEVIHSSSEHYLKPLVECVKKFKGKVGGCVLHDKVVGLAAARLISYSQMAGEVHALVASKKAEQHLEEAGIKLYADEIVEKILNLGGTAQCPMEAAAEAAACDEEFYLKAAKSF